MILYGRLRPISENIGMYRRIPCQKWWLGRENAKTYLQENPDVLEKIVKNVRIFVGLDEGEEEAAA